MNLPSRRTSIAVAIAVAASAATIATGTYIASASTAATAATGQIVGMAGKCIGAAGGKSANGTAIDLYPCTKDATQQWTFPGDGTIRSAGKCMDVAGGEKKDGTKVQLYDCNGSPAQQWVYSSGMDLVNPNPDKCLELADNSSADFTVTQISTCRGTANQKWTVPSGAGSRPADPANPPATPTQPGSGSGMTPAAFWGDTAGIPTAKKVLTFKILNRTNGKYPDNQVFWTFNGQTKSIAEQSTIDVPVVSAARMSFHLGAPDSKYTDFVELNTKASWIGVNTTRVDAFGLKLALRLRTKSGAETTVGEDYPTFAEDRAATFQRFADEVPAEFKGLAKEQAPYRIPSPVNSPAFQSGGQYQNYFSSYTSSVGKNVSTSEVFACTGSVLGNNAPLCGALNRHVAHLPADQWKVTSGFYRSGPANYYAKFWHDHAIDKKAYGFAYDDAADQSSFIAYDNPQYMIAAVGW